MVGPRSVCLYRIYADIGYIVKLGIIILTVLSMFYKMQLLYSDSRETYARWTHNMQYMDDAYAMSRVVFLSWEVSLPATAYSVGSLDGARFQKHENIILTTAEARKSLPHTSISSAKLHMYAYNRSSL